MMHKYRQIQSLTKTIMADIAEKIAPGKTEVALLQDCQNIIAKHQLNEFWYHGVPVMVAVGANTLLSASGQYYQPTNDVIAEHDVVTVDLSLALDGHWSIFAKSFVVANGQIIYGDIDDAEVKILKQTSIALHQYIQEIAQADMTYHELYHALTDKIKTTETKHLDFKNNFGHNIANQLDERIYITDGESRRLGSHCLFSFEPHLRLVNGRYGYKAADIYYFDQAKARCLSE